MKQQWKKLAAQVDARALRERAMLFAAALAVVGAAAYLLVFAPMWRTYTQLNAAIVSQASELADVRRQIDAKIAAHKLDPDADTRARLAQVRAERAALTGSLVAMQRGLVPSEKMTGLLASLLRANGRAQLVEMRTLAVTPVGQAGVAVEPPAAGGPAMGALAAGALAANGTAPLAPEATVRPDGKPSAAGPAPLYRHGVRLILRGTYLDLVDYMAALEALPTQLFWGNAELEVEQFPNVKLSLTLYTLSLDRVWMKL